MEMVLPVGEIVVVPMHATVGELKQAVENALKETYSITDEFVLMEAGGIAFCEVWQHTRCCGIEDSETLPPLFPRSSS